MAEPKISQQVLEDFMATVAKNPNVDRQQLLQVFPEFGNDMKMLDAAFDYRATRLENPNADIATVNSKFPEFFGTSEPAQTQPAAQPGVSGGSLLSEQEELARQNAIQGVTNDPNHPFVEKRPSFLQSIGGHNPYPISATTDIQGRSRQQQQETAAQDAARAQAEWESMLAPYKEQFEAQWKQDAPVLDEVWNKANERAKSAAESVQRNKPQQVNLPSAMGGGFGNIGYSLMASREANKQNSPEAIIEAFERELDNKYQSKDVKGDIQLAQEMGATTDEYQLYKRFVEDKIAERFVGQNIPQDKLDYFARKFIQGNLIVQLASLYTQSPQSRQYAMQGTQQYEQANPGWATKGVAIGAEVANVVADPLMWIMPGVGEAAGRGIVNAAGRRLASVGLSDAAGAAERAAMQRGLLRTAQRLTSGGVMMAGIDTGHTLVGDLYQTGEVNWSNLATAPIRGALTGMAFTGGGALGERVQKAVGDVFGRDLGLIAGRATHFAAGTNIMVGSSVASHILQGGSPDDIDWGIEYANAAAMQLFFDIQGGLKTASKAKGFGNAWKAMRQDPMAHTLTREEIEQFNAVGIEGNDAYTILKNLNGGKEFTSLEEYYKVLNDISADERIDTQAKYKLASLLYGKVDAHVSPIYVGDVESVADGYVVKTYDNGGMTYETRKFDTQRAADVYRARQHDATRNNMLEWVEGIIRTRGFAEKMQEVTDGAIDKTIENYPQLSREDAYRVLSADEGSLTPIERAIRGQMEKYLAEDIKGSDILKDVREQVAREQGVSIDDLSNLLSREYSRLSAKDKTVFENYLDRLNEYMPRNNDRTERRAIGEGGGTPVAQEPEQPISPAAAEYRRAVDEVTQAVGERTHRNGYIYPVAMPGNAEKTGFIVGEVVPVIDESNPEQLRIENDDIVTVKWSDGTVTQERARDLDLTGAPMMAQQAVDIEVENQMYAYTQQRIQNGEQPVLMRDREGILEGFFPTEGGLLEDQNGVQYTPEQLAEQGWQETKPVLFVNDMQQIAALDNGDGTYTQVDALGNPIAEPMSAEAFSEQGFAMVPLEEEQQPLIEEKPEPLLNNEYPPTSSNKSEILLTNEGQTPAAPVVPNIETMSAADYAGAAVEYMGSREYVDEYLDGEIKKVQQQLGVANRKKVGNVTDMADFKAKKDAIEAKKKALQDRLDKLTEAREKAKSYLTIAEREQRAQAEAERKAAEEAARIAREQATAAEAARLEQERIDRELKKGVPDFSEDNDRDARNRGFHVVNGQVIHRQEPLQPLATGKAVTVQFAKGQNGAAEAHHVLVPISMVQPSHINGQRNPAFFISEAQPKDRRDQVSKVTSDMMAQNIHPDEIVEGATAYVGAPVVNGRGEAVQGNNRMDALIKMYQSHPESVAKYKQYLIDNAVALGYTEADIETIRNNDVIDVRMLDNVTDEQAIQLGQKKATDLETGGVQLIDPQVTANQLGDRIQRFSEILLRSEDDEATLADLTLRNGRPALEFLQKLGIISDAQMQSAFDSRGNLTAEAKAALQGVLKQVLFQNAESDNLPIMFDDIPVTAQKAILQTIVRDLQSPEESRLVPDIQEAIGALYRALHQSAEVKKGRNEQEIRAAMRSWALQMQFPSDFDAENFVPSEKFSNFALELATLFKYGKQTEIAKALNAYYDAVQGTTGSLFGDTPAIPYNEAVKQIFNIDYERKREVGTVVADKSKTGDGGRREQPAVDTDRESGSDESRSAVAGTGDNAAGSGIGSSAEGTGGTGDVTQAEREEFVSLVNQYLTSISSKETKGVLFDNNSMVSLFRKLGFSEEMIQAIEAAQNEGDEVKVRGFNHNGVVFLNVDAISTPEDARNNYVHERQHSLTLADPHWVGEVMKATSEEELTDLLNKHTKNHYYDNKKFIEKADEFISYAMEIAYSVSNNEELERALKDMGANDALINIIKSINDEQRKDNDLSLARRTPFVDGRDGGDSQQDGGDRGTRAETGLEPEGAGSTESGTRGTESGAEQVTPFKDTPLGKVAAEFRRQYPDAAVGVLFREKDTYEFYDKDAVRAAEILGLQTTEKDGVPFLSFPLEKLQDYLGKLVRGGMKIGIARKPDHKPTKGDYQIGDSLTYNGKTATIQDFTYFGTAILDVEGRRVEVSREQLDDILDYGDYMYHVGDVVTYNGKRAQIVDFASGDPVIQVEGEGENRYVSFSEIERVKQKTPTENRETSETRATETEIGGALVDRLEDMGLSVSTDLDTNRAALKAAKADKSDAGAIHYYKTPSGQQYGFSYKGRIYLDPTKIDAELPIHEYGHLWAEAMRRISPESWRSVVDTIKADQTSWDFVRELRPELTDENEIAEEVIATFSGKRGAEKMRAEYERMHGKDADYKSKWGNIFQNISKAIQDFWKAVGDFLNIKYQSAEQIYDQVLKDFVDNMNPYQKVRDFLRARDAEYIQAAESGDIQKATNIFYDALRENIGNGITPYMSVGTYLQFKRLAKGVKTRDAAIIREAAEKIAPLIPDNAVLVPTPSHTGRATDMLDLANAIAEITGSEVADILRSAPRESQYQAKKETGTPMASQQLGIMMEGTVPADKTAIVIDNVVDSGNTAEACIQALGKGVVVTLADSAEQYRHAASLRSAAPILRDKDGKIVPLTKRFNLNGSRYLGRRMYLRPNDPRFAISGTQVIPVGEKTLVGLHNISAEKLRKVMKAGGLANPSAAVIDIAKQDHHDYGEVSLVLPSSLVERADGTYPGDAWTPMYPPVEYRAGKDTEKRIKALTKGLPDNLASAIALRIRDYMDGNSRNSGMEYLYLKEQGRELPIEHTPRRYPYISIKQIADRLGIAEPEYWSSDVYQAYEQLPEDQLFDFNLWLEQNGNQEEIDKRKAMVERWRSEGKDAFANTWVGRQSERMSFAAFDSAGYRILRDERDAGEENTGMTLDKASYIVDTEGLRPEFETWLQQKIDGLGYEEVLFGGYSPSGNRRWLPNTVENASKLMNQKSQTNYLERESVNETKAMLMEKFRTLAQIRKHRDILEPDREKIKAAYEAVSSDWNQLGMDFRDYTQTDKRAYQLDDNPFIAIDTALARIQEAMFKADPIAFLNREYRYSLPADSEFGTRIKEIKERIKNLPSRYFETKFRRPVYLDEFANAVVPVGLPQDLRDGLTGAGMTLFEYDPAEQGSRRAATLKATADEGIRFSISGNTRTRYADEMESIKNNALNNGTFMQAPNGKPTHLTERQWLQVRTRAFKRWFGDWENDPQNASKVLDENGEPMVVYHRTNNKFTQFDPDRAREQSGWPTADFGFYFSNVNERGHYGRKSMPVFLNIRNPREIDVDYYAEFDYNYKHADPEEMRKDNDGLQINIGRLILDEKATKVFVAPNPNQIKSATDNDGSFSEENNDIRFSISNQNNDIFYSNAERAVEGIKQEKATPEQWRAMIEKAGGLKAGEDKWLGLSDWLAQQRANIEVQPGDTRRAIADRVQKFTVSKQDILDYIRQNKIQIEEVEYGDVTDSGEFKRLEDEFSELCWDIDEVYTQRWVEANNEVEKFYDEMRNKYGDEYLDALSPDEQRTENYLLDAREVYNKENPDYDDAFQEMVRRYGDDFEMAFWHAGARLYANDNDAAAYYAGEANAINDTRLKYTTEGLENKREIALTVPTIESWNESDEIHFGDAGEGRAVAWIRFGDANSISKPEELTQAEEEYRDFSRKMIQQYGLTYSERVMSDAERQQQSDLIAQLNQARKEHPQVEEKVLVIDEIQSKRHQEGREKGYKSGESELDRQYKEAQVRHHKMAMALMDKYGYDWMTKASREEMAEYAADQREFEKIQNKWMHQPDIPAAPFEKNWHELAMKRILRFAAENGYDKVAWTTGDQQAERYNLGKQLEQIDVLYNDETGTYSVYVTEKGYDPVEDAYTLEEGLDDEGLRRTIGKDLYNRVMEQGKQDSWIGPVVLTGDDLVIGTDGMRGFYDDILPRFMQKYGKKWGVQVGEVTMPQLEDGYQTMHSVDITDAMRESVLEGQPMFSISGPRRDLGTMAVQPGETRKEYAERVSTAIKSMTPRNTTIDDAIRFSITVNHNSPYLLKKADGSFVDPETGERLGFDHRFMGRGEGGQAHGWGTYLSVNDLRDYAENHLVMGDSEEAKEEEERIYSAFDIPGLNNTPYFGIFDDPRSTIFRIVSAVNENKERPQSLKLWLEDKLKESKEIISSIPTHIQASNEDWYKKREAKFNEMFIPVLLKYMKHDLDMRNRHHYTVEIPDNDGTNYLEEGKAPKRALRKMLKAMTDEQKERIASIPVATYTTGEEIFPKSDLESRILWLINKTGWRDLYEVAEIATGSKQAASELLHKAGFVGIHYDGRRDGECYVIFNPDDAVITDHIRFSVTGGENDKKGIANEDDQIRSDKFKAWFGDWQNDPEHASKVVDADGKPLVVEHSTPNEFTTFDIDKLGENSGDRGIFGTGFYFGDRGNTDIYGKNHMQVYLNMHKPFVMEDYMPDDISAFIVEHFNTPALRKIVLNESGKSITVGEYIDIVNAVNAEMEEGKHDAEIERISSFYHPDSARRKVRDDAIADKSFLIPGSLNYLIGTMIGSQEFTNALRENGNDGVIVGKGNGYNEYVVFSPNQIKSATENNGEFSRDNDDIRFSVSGRGREDRDGNPIGDGDWHMNYKVQEFPEYPQISSRVDKSVTTESVYVTYTNADNGRSVKVRFSGHRSNAERFGDVLTGGAPRGEILYRLGLATKEWQPFGYVPIGTISNKQIAEGNYEVADKTRAELERLPKGTDISEYKGKLVPGEPNRIYTGTFVGESQSAGIYIYKDANGNEIRGGLREAIPQRRDGNDRTWKTVAEVDKELQEKGYSDESPIRFSVAYHGTGADFDKFLKSKINTGEGSQAFGWGLYFTDAKEIAEDYAKRQARMPKNVKDAYLGEQKLNPVAPESDLDCLAWVLDMNELRNIRTMNPDVARSIVKNTIALKSQELRDRIKFYEGNGATRMVESAREELEYYRRAGELVREVGVPNIEFRGDRNLYTVSIPEDNGMNYFEWNAEIDDRLKSSIIDGIVRRMEQMPEYGNTPGYAARIVPDFMQPYHIGGVVYQVGTRWLPKEEMSEVLAELGYKGIKYDAGTNFSQGVPDGAKNYVVFDDKDIEITEHIRFSISGSGTMKPQADETRKEYIERVATAVKRMTPRNTTIDDAIRFSITVNHNSPYLLKRADGSFVDPETGERLGFDHRFMGRGEGGQAHGWGSYFSVNDIRSYGEGYGFSLRDIKDAFNTSRWQSFGVGDAFDVAKGYLLEAHSEHARSLRKWLEDRLAQKQELLKSYEGKVANTAEEGLMVFRAEADVQYIPALLRDMVKDIDTRNRHHYTVEIPENDGTNYLDEIKTLPKPLRRKIAAAVRELPGEPMPSVKYVKYTGGWRQLADMIERNQWAYMEIRDRLVQAFGSKLTDEKRLSNMMHDIGFVGIHYDGRRDGECYVIFDENDAVITDHIRFAISVNGKAPSSAVTEALVKQANDSFRLMQSALKKVSADLRTINAIRTQQREYDRKIVDMLLNLYNSLLQENSVWAGYMPDTTRRIATQIVHAVGKKDISAEVNTIMDHMVHAQAKAAQRQWDKLRTTPVDKINISGVVMQGKVALQGQHALKAMNEALDSKATIEQLEDQIAQLMEMEDNATDESLKLQYKGQWIGYTIAAQHLERIQHLEEERRSLDLELQAARSNKTLKPSARQQLVANIKQAMRDNFIAQADAYAQSAKDLAEYVTTQEEQAKDFIHRQDTNRDKIRSYAQRDLRGISTDNNRDISKSNIIRSIWDAVASPIRDLQSLLRLTGVHAPDGEGYLYNHFMRGWMDAADKERLGIVNAGKTLDAKINELTHGKYKTWEEAARKINDASHNMFTVTTLNGVDGEDMPYSKEIKLNAGNALYIYAVNKMTDGRMKLAGMDITEEDVKALVDKVREQFGQEILDVVDWVQSEYFSQLRNRYNPTHEALFGAPMGAIENYFPLRLSSAARQKNVDLGDPDTDVSMLLSGSTTGAIKRRTKNSIPIDLQADFFQEVIRHVAQMERWNAFAQWTRDANILFSDINFRERVKNMKSSVYGTGDALYNYMKDAFKVANGTYRQTGGNIQKGISDVTLNIAKGVTSAKINFRVWTAMKQIASFPAFFTYMQDGVFVKSYMHNWGHWYETMEWAKENLPNFEKRVSKRDMGDFALMRRSTDWKITQRIMDMSTKYGMAANVFFDTLTCATGARAVYESRLAEYMKKGYSEEDARNRARQDAEQAFNTSQQSSEGAFMAPVQADRNIITSALIVFRTSPIQYTRNFFYHTRGIVRKLQPGAKEKMIAFRMGQYKNDGLTDEQARKAAEMDFDKSMRQDIVGFVVYGAVLNILWRLAGNFLYYLFGDDDDKKKELLLDAVTGGAFVSPITGLLGGSNIESKLDGHGSISGILAPELPLTQDAKKAEQYLDNNKYAEFASQALSILLQSGTGFDPQTAADAITRVVVTLDSEQELDAAQQSMFVLNALLSIPQSQYEQMLVDRVVADESEYDAALADYIRYQKVHTAPLTWWMRGDESAEKAEENAEKRFDRLLNERDELHNPEEE